MKIWIDLANSPQVFFFRPIISKLEGQGHIVSLTTRNFAQTNDLADLFGFHHIVIGGHGGKKISNIGLTLLKRAWQLIQFAKGKGFDLAVSHNSYSQIIAARCLGIRVVTSMDYEHQPANHLAFRLAHKVIVPEFFPDEALKRFGAKKAKVMRYHGTKEQFYLGDFKPHPNYLESLGIPKDKIIVVMRPPATWALYHHFENPLFDSAIEHVTQYQNAHVIFLPRIPTQAVAVKSKDYKNIFIPPVVLDGPNILYYADLVISAGGTMNREAAVLGTPTYSLFKGKLASVDHYLMEKVWMWHIDSIEKINSIIVCKKNPRGKTMINSKNLVDEIVQMIVLG